MKILLVSVLCFILFGRTAFSQAVFTPRTMDRVVVKGFTGGTTTSGVALSGSTTPWVLQDANWTGTPTACIGFSNGKVGQIVVSGLVTFDLGGLDPGKLYYVGANGTVSVTGTTTTGYITQFIMRAIGTNTAIVNIAPPTTN